MRCRLADLRAVLTERTDPAAFPHAEAVDREILIYSAGSLPATPAQELVAALTDGPGVVVVRGAFDPAVVRRATAAFDEMIAAQRSSGTAGGDHFAAPGANDRVWNALGKLADADPAVFVDYYANPALAQLALAWLGPGYQVTSQVNVVNPGGAGQVGHRDYHLGLLSPERMVHYPEHVHRLSPVLTLQGAVAHCDMPLESGPTCYLPHSQRYRDGYPATARAEFREYFDTHHVQLPLGLGDAVFFNPAVIHGAGANRTGGDSRWPGVRRHANLLQISSAFGRAMEAVDRLSVCTAVYPALLARAGRDPDGAARALAAAAEGYPFPADLDTDPPRDGLAPPSQADLVTRALAARWAPERLAGELADQQARRAGRAPAGAGR